MGIAIACAGVGDYLLSRGETRKRGRRGRGTVTLSGIPLSKLDYYYYTFGYIISQSEGDAGV